MRAGSGGSSPRGDDMHSRSDDGFGGSICQNFARGAGPFQLSPISGNISGYTEQVTPLVMINADKPQRWKADIAKSVDMFNEWFLRFAPKAYRDTRVKVTEEVRESLQRTNNLRNLGPAALREHPETLRTLRMATCPPLARDRLAGLARATRGVIGSLEKGKLPPRISDADLQRQLADICKTISTMLDTDIFPWLEKHGSPTQQEQYRASTIVADRLCGAVSDPIIRNAQERRQLACIQRYLERKGYKLLPHPPSR